MRMFHLPSNLEILNPFWDFPQRLLKVWGRPLLFFAHLSLHPHPKHAIFRLTVVIYPARAWAKSPPPHIPPAEFDESWQRRTGLSSWAWCAISELKDNVAPEPHHVCDPLNSPLKPASPSLLSQRRPCSVQTRTCSLSS